MPLEQRAEACNVRGELPGDAVGSLAHKGLLLVRPLENPLGFRSGFPQDQLGFPFRLLPTVDPELLRGNQSFIHGPLAVAERPQLLLQAPESLLMLGPVSQQALQQIPYGQL